MVLLRSLVTAVQCVLMLGFSVFGVTLSGSRGDTSYAVVLFVISGALALTIYLVWHAPAAVPEARPKPAVELSGS